MPLSEAQRRQLQARLQQPAAPSAAAPALPPDIAAIAARVPQGRPYLKTLGAKPSIAFPMPQEQIQQELGVEAAKQQIRHLHPSVGEATRRDFARIDAFEGILSDLEQEASRVRKGPMQGRYAAVGSRVTGGGAFPGVQEAEATSAVTYSDLRSGVAAGLYRAITGDDRISDMDAAKRALPFVPDLSLNPRAFTKRLQIVKRAIQRKRQSIRTSLRLGQEAMGSAEEDSLPTFLSVISEALSEDDDD